MRDETGRAVLAATARLAPPAGTPTLSTLAGRIAATRGLALVPAPSLAAPASAASACLTTPAPELVTAPPADRRALIAHDVRHLGAVRTDSGQRDGQAALPGVALLGAHGGAGVTSLLRSGLAEAGGYDADRRWPVLGPVLLVARRSVSGLEWARDLARQHASGTASPASRLVGVVLVADAPGRPPARVQGLADLVSGAFARTWQVPWLEPWRLAALTEPLPLHPEVARLHTDIRALTRPPSAANSRRPTRSGVLL